MNRLISSFPATFGYLLLLWIFPATLTAQDAQYQLTLPPKEQPGTFASVQYDLWLPDTNQPVRGILLRQHGCGPSAAEGGKRAILDWHWRAVAAEQGLAYMGSSYAVKEDCGEWRDPELGSEETFLRSLEQFAELTDHPELSRVPWVLWGHSGGGYWVFRMTQRHPERVAAALLQSPARLDTTAYPASVPSLVIVGLHESYNRFSPLFRDALAFSKHHLRQGHPITFAIDPETDHHCGQSRYLMLPFVRQVLPRRISPTGELLAYDRSAETHGSLSFRQVPVTPRFDARAIDFSWLPDTVVGHAWRQFMRMGTGADSTPPPPPTQVVLTPTDSGNWVRWQYVMDLKGGLSHFKVYRNGALVSPVEPPAAQRYRLTYHDTPRLPLPPCQWFDPDGKPADRYEVQQVNAFGVGGQKAVASKRK